MWTKYQQIDLWWIYSWLICKLFANRELFAEHWFVPSLLDKRAAQQCIPTMARVRPHHVTWENCLVRQLVRVRNGPTGRNIGSESLCFWSFFSLCSLGVGLFMTMSSDHENAVKEHYVYEFSAKLQYGDFFFFNLGTNSMCDHF